MFNWIIGFIALALWVAATLLYLRGHIARAWAERRKRKEVEAKIREMRAKGPGA